MLKRLYPLPRYFLCGAQLSVQMTIAKVGTLSKYGAKLLTFEYLTDYSVFTRITGWGATQLVPYLNHFPTNLDEVKFVRKLLIISFQTNRCALMEPRW